MRRTRFLFTVLGSVLPLALAPPARSEPVSLAKPATAQEPVSPASTPIKLELDVPVLLALQVPRHELDWPITPLHFSLTPVAARFGWNSTIPMYRAEALWLQQGPLSLRSVSSVEESTELLCPLGCTAVIERTLGLEARFALGSVGPAPETYGFMRGENVWSRGVTSSRLRVGLGGTLDF